MGVERVWVGEEGEYYRARQENQVLLCGSTGVGLAMEREVDIHVNV